MVSLCFQTTPKYFLQNLFYLHLGQRKEDAAEDQSQSHMKAHLADKAQSEANDNRQNPNLIWIALSVLVWTWMNILTFKPNCLEHANHKRTSRNRVHTKASH